MEASSALDLPGLEDLGDLLAPSGTTAVTAPKAGKFSREKLNDRLRELDMLKNKGRGKAKVALSEEVTREKEGLKGTLIHTHPCPPPYTSTAAHCSFIHLHVHLL